TINSNGIIMPMKQRSETITEKDGTTRVIKAWYLTNEENVKLSQRVVDGIVIASSNLVASEIIESEAEDLAKYGLDGRYYVQGKAANGTSYKIILGNMLYNRDGYYAMREGDNTVYSISLYSANLLYTSRAELLDLNIFQGALSDVESFSLYKAGELRFTVETEPVVTWILTHPVFSKADVYNADEMINNLLDLAIDEYVDVAPDDLSLYGLDNPRYSVSIMISGVEYMMQIGREDIVNNTFYAMMEDKNEVFSINATSLNFLDNDAKDMVYPYPYIPSIINVKSVDINIDGMELLLEMTFDSESNLINYVFNGEALNLVVGIQTFGSWFFQQMITVPVIDLEPVWEISGEPYGKLIYTYTDGVFETIEYYARDENSCYYVRNGSYDGLVVDRSFLSRERGFAALVDLVISGKISRLKEEENKE
ncbi:MAG: DUF4340 domain-containing protein, partial [Clostridia bacterium]